MAALVAFLFFFISDPFIAPPDCAFYWAWAESLQTTLSYSFSSALESLQMPARYCYLTETGRLANDWPMGTGLLLLPASWAGTTWSHAWILLLALISLTAWIRGTAAFPPIARALATAGMILGTPLFFYAFFGPFFSHIASFAIVTLFLVQWATVPAIQRDKSQWFLSGLLLGISVLIRPQNALLILIYLADIPSLFQSRPPIPPRELIPALLLLIAGFILGLSPRLPAYAVLYGNPLQLPKLEEMHWFSPNMFLTLFSDYHGILPWTPITIVGLAGLLLALKSHTRIATGLLLVFLTQVYINAANEIWWSGGSFGNRRLTDYSIVIAWGLLFLLTSPRRSLRSAVLAILIVCSAWSFTLLLAERRLILPLDRYIPLYHDQFLSSLGVVYTHPLATWQATTRALTPDNLLVRASASAMLFLATLILCRAMFPPRKTSLQRAALYLFSTASVLLFTISAVAAYRTPPLQQSEIPNNLPSSSTILWDNYLELTGYHLVKKEYPAALATIDKAIAILPRQPGGYWYRALAHLQSGQKDKAIADLRKILELEPRHANAQALLQELAPATPSSATLPGNWRR